MTILDTLSQNLTEAFLVDQTSTRHFILSAAAIALVWLVRILILSVVRRRTDDVRIQYRWKKASQYTMVFSLLAILGLIWFDGIKPLFTYFGLLSAGLAIALRELVANLVGWAFILWRKPFDVGDRIEIGAVSGDVIDLRIFQFTLLEIGNWVEADQSTGRIIHVNNGRVFTDPLANFTRGFQYIWNEIPVLITFESDWREAKAILTDIVTRHAEHLSKSAERRVRQASNKFMIFYNKLTPTVYTTVRDCGVLLTLRYLCPPRGRRTSEEEIWEEILTTFGARDTIDFAYPTTRYYDNRREGKPGASPAGPEAPP